MGRKPPVQYTEALAIKAWLMREKGHTNEEIKQKLDISGGSVTLWIRKVENSPRLKSLATKKATVKENPQSSGNGENNKIEEISNLMTENAYLRWWNLGLQQGFVDRLLKDMDMK